MKKEQVVLQYNCFYEYPKLFLCDLYVCFYVIPDFLDDFLNLIV